MPGDRYTFAVCVRCGTQSPPIINPHLVDMDKALKDMGWKVDTRQFTVLATCPRCQDDEDDGG